MKILLDECLPLDFHHQLGQAVHTAEWAELKGLKNGRLLRIPHQQNLANRRFSILIIEPGQIGYVSGIL